MTELISNCSKKACPFPVLEGNTVCRYHHLEAEIAESYSDSEDLEFKSADLFHATGKPKSHSSRSLTDEGVRHELSVVRRWQFYRKNESDWDAEGKCLRCGGDRGGKPKICRTCLNETYEMQAFLRRTRIAQGRCPHCNAPHDTGKKHCANCRQSFRRLYVLKLSRGICVECGQPRELQDRTRCASCAAARSNAYRSFVDAGLCGNCGRENDSGNTTCSSCTFAKLKRSANKVIERRSAASCTRCGTKTKDPRWRMCRECRDHANESARKRRKDGYRRPRTQKYRYVRSILSREHARVQKQKRRELAKAIGLCLTCGKVADLGGATCSGCRLRSKAKKGARRASGRCTQCGQARDTKLVICSSCHQKKKNRIEKLIAAGLCPKCQRDRTDSPSKTLCKFCLQREREYDAKKKAAGKCLNCGRKRTDRTQLCANCAKAAANRKARTIESGLCRVCGRKRGTDGTTSRCASCAQKERDRYWKRKGGRPELIA
jgi:hypothetical protein